MDVFKVAQMEWAEPIMFAPKTDSLIEFFLNYCKSDNVTVRDLYAIPSRDECIDSLGEATVFSKSNVNRDYLQMDRAGKERYMRAFT